MTKRKLVKIELTNSRFTRMELRDHASEFIHYARYAGYELLDFNKHLGEAKLRPVKPEIAERNHRLVVDTSLSNAKVLQQITMIYPSFKTWKIRLVQPETEPAMERESKPATKHSRPRPGASAERPSAKKAVKSKPIKPDAPKRKPPAKAKSVVAVKGAVRNPKSRKAAGKR